MCRYRYIDRYKCLPQKIELTYVYIQVLRTSNPTLSGSASVCSPGIIYFTVVFTLFGN